MGQKLGDRWLDEIKELGADAVEINIPVKVKSDGSVGYNMYDPPYWLSTTFDEGTEDSIKRYVQQAQQKGFKVFLDIPSLMHDQLIDRRFNLDPSSTVSAGSDAGNALLMASRF